MYITWSISINNPILNCTFVYEISFLNRLVGYIWFSEGQTQVLKLLTA